MKFIVDKEVFEILPDVSFGVVVGYGIDNTSGHPEIKQMLENQVHSLHKLLEDKNLKDYPSITPYREAFLKLGINPNKYMSSIEAMAKRISKGNMLPSINGIVDLANSVSLKYILPIGAHDMDVLKGDIKVRFAKEGDKFNPLGTSDVEEVDPGEMVYANKQNVLTRRWIWRQWDGGKITEDSKNIFFPIDGFEDSNKANLIEASNLLADQLEKYFHCKTKKFFVNKDLNEIEIN